MKAHKQIYNHFWPWATVWVESQVREDGQAWNYIENFLWVPLLNWSTKNFINHIKRGI